MNYLRSLIRNLLRRPQLERELDAEMQAHLQLLADEKVAAGVDPQTARRRARMELDGMETVKEEVRDARAGSLLEQVAQDARYGVRVLRASPLFTLVAVLSLALGIGANTTIFSIANAVLFRPLPYAQPDRLMMIWEKDDHGRPDNATFATWSDWRAQSKSFEDMALVSSWSLPLTEGREPEQLVGLRVTNNFFRLLGVRPMLGRDFRPEEDTPAASHVVMLSYQLWRRRFASDPNIAGKTISLAQVPFVVAGVLPPDFPPLISQGVKGEQPEIYRVLGYDLTLPWSCRSCHHLNAVGRLRPGIHRQQAEAEMNLIQDGLVKRYPKEYSGNGVILQPLQDYIVGPVSPTLRLLLGTVGFVLLLACVNLSNLMLARSASRRREMSIRTALGASRARVVRQLLTENCLVALLAAVLGLIPAVWAAALVRVLGGGDIPRLNEVHVDGRVLLFCAALALVAGLISGLGPTLRLSRGNLDDHLKEGARSVGGAASRTNAVLVTVEVCFSLVLLVGAGLLLRSLMLVLAVDPGFRPDHVLALKVGLVGKAYQKDQPVRLFYQQAEDRIAALPGVEGVAASSQIPLSGNLDRYGFHAVDKTNAANPERDPFADRFTVTPGYLRTMGIPLLKGRDFQRSDAEGTQPVIIINRAAAERVWSGEDPLGKQVKFGDPKLPAWTVIGVVGDVHHDALDQQPAMQFYTPHAQWPNADTDMTFVVRTAGDPEAMTAAVERAIRSVDAQPISHVTTLERMIGVSVISRRLVLSLLGGFALLALVLAAVGVYGVAAYGVAQRTREIGIRMALGATPTAVRRMVLGEGLRLTLAGIALGMMLAVAATRLLAGMLFGVKTTDPATLVGVTLLLLAVATAAVWVPALRATRIEPQSALRHD